MTEFSPAVEAAYKVIANLVNQRETGQWHISQENASVMVKEAIQRAVDHIDLFEWQEIQE